MRIALLTALAAHPEQQGVRLAFRRFLGRPVLGHQLDCALALECESIVCFVDGLRPEIIACQHRAEAAGARFVAIDANRRLSGLVKADDEVLVFADGLLPDPEVIEDCLAKRPGILVFPAAAAVPRGFERIDADWAWAGVLRTRGDSVERLADLAPDSDAASALLRIALQSGTRTLELDPSLLVDAQWDILGDSEAISERERRWISRNIPPARFSAPGLAVAERVGVRLARDIVGTRLEQIPAIAGVAAGVLAGLAAALDRPLIGLCLALPMAFLLPAGSAIARVSRIGARIRRRLPVFRTLGWAADILLAGLIALTTPAQNEGWLRLFVPLVLLGLLRLGERIGPVGYRETYADRVVLVALLVPAAFMGHVQAASAALALLALGSLFVTSAPPKLTSN